MPGSVSCGRGQVPLPGLAAGVFHREERGATGRKAKSDLEKKYMKFLLGEKWNSRAFIQFHGSRVKSDRSSWPPLSIKWFAIQVFSTILQNYSPSLQLATTDDFLRECCSLFSIFSHPPNLAFIYQIISNIHSIHYSQKHQSQSRH